MLALATPTANWQILDMDSRFGLVASGLVCRGAVAWVLALVGCTTAIDGPDPARADFDAIATAHCQLAAECGCPGREDMDACLTELNDTWLARLMTGRADGLTYDPACADGIADAITAHGCAGPGRDSSHLCSSYCAPFHGERELGATCTRFDALVSDCAQGLTCSEGICRDPCHVFTGLPEGEICWDNSGQLLDRCADHLICNGQCEPPAGPGEQCGFCAKGYFCDYYSSDIAVCAEAADAGESCGLTECKPGLYCAYELGDRCEPYAKLGEACVDRRCDDGLSCDGVCQGPAPEGESCASRPCVEASVCDYARNLCVAPPPVDAPCIDGRCEVGAVCDFDTGTCRAAAAVGEPCTGHAQCDTRYCPAGRCAELPGIGESCQGTLTCAVGARCDGSVCLASPSRGPAACVYEGW